MGARASITEHSEIGHERKQGAQWVYEQALKPIDGARGTWSWMLEEGNRGCGLVPMITDVEYWDVVGNTWTLTKNQPYIYPAFISWQAPNCFDYEHCTEGIPVLKVTGGSWLGDDSEYHSMILHTFLLDEYCYCNSHGPDPCFYVPVWFVTPLDEDAWTQWSTQFSALHSKIGGWLIDSIVSDDYGWHGQYINAKGESIECESSPDEHSDSDSCPCGLHRAQDQMIIDLESGALWPKDLDDQFKDVWRWTVSRWLSGWNSINDLSRREDCPYSLASSHSPYSRTLDSDDLAQEKERLCSIPFMSSVHSPEYSTEHSPQLTLFDT
jgi:hypothetical protein